MDWLEDKINSRDWVFIGYSSYTRGKITSTANGVWLGFYKGRRVFTMKYQDALTKQKFSKDIHTHLRAVNHLFGAVWGLIQSPPLILLSSKKAVQWLQRGTYKYFDVTDKTKTHLYTFIDTFTPEFDSYNCTENPYSILREFCLNENKRVKKQIVKGFETISNI